MIYSPLVATLVDNSEYIVEPVIVAVVADMVKPVVVPLNAPPVTPPKVLIPNVVTGLYPVFPKILVTNNWLDSCK